MRQPKPEIITFKAAADLLKAMKGIRNRSAFIRSAVLAALNNVCPLCRGAGTLNPKQREHWDAFAETHPVAECDDCHELHLVCENRR
ncbi:MAG TPA: CopG family transcriptional regulator [Phycisphaerae bacterium]|nr:CopG family transcriptional regulator [Phycisphaerae bacterium]HUU60486.1 CopG family transcriptional regulator [Phycisphaerae bacterium]